MPRNIQNENEKLIHIIGLSSNGLTVEEILQAFNKTIPKRTLQYRLSKLVKLNLLKHVGAGRSSRYHPPTKPEKRVKEEPSTYHTFPLIPLTEEALNVKKLISQPLQLRRHVSYQKRFLSYQKRFLEEYRPNTTFYLSKSDLEKLQSLGSGVEKGRPAGTYAKKVYQRLLVDLSWNSSRLEGNTYSLLETEKLLAFGEVAEGKDSLEAQMILNHKEAIEFIVEMAEEIDINHYTILNIHGLLSHDLLLDPKACGRLRTIPVKIGKSVYHPLEVPSLIEEYFHLIIQKASAINTPFEQSFFLMVHLPYLQPFLDVNKRVSRLAGNIPFIRENLSPLTFVDVPKSDYIQGLLAIYELNQMELFREVFIWAYERSASLYLATLEAIGQPDPFRVRYRELIRQAIYQIVHSKISKDHIIRYMTQFCLKNIPLEHQKRFIEVIEIEISSLHEGNFARFKIRPTEFFEWQKEQG